MTGRLPPSHTLRDNGFTKLPAAETTLAEVLKGAGFTTGAFIGAEVLDARYGLSQGFDTYDDRMVERGPAGILAYPERRGEDVAGAALAWLPSRGRVFVWVHLFDPHAPYRPPEPEKWQHAAPTTARLPTSIGSSASSLPAGRKSAAPATTLVVITADHGEALGAHGEKTHGVLVHETRPFAFPSWCAFRDGGRPV
jgi:arylsulfatase A-like enzyme